jgi:thiamine biosynthesis lipoprotein
MQETKSRTILYTILTCLAMAGVVWLSLTRRSVSVDSGYRMTMGTFARVVAVAKNPQQADNAVAAAFEAIEAVNRTMSDYDPNSLLSQVNREAFEQPVKVDADLFEVLTAAQLYSCTSDGAFDVTIGPVIQLWRTAKDENTVPTQEAIAKAKEAVGYENLVLDAEDKTVKFAKKGMFIDLGGIAKGYAIDKAIEILQDAGLKGGMVDIGGDLRCFGTPADSKRHWLIGLQDPQNEEEILMTLNMDDRAVATSGDYRRFVVIGEKKHSHIVNPATADSAADLSSVTIIAPSAMAADALATAVTVMGDEKGMELIESIEHTEAILIPHREETSFEKTTGVKQYIQK